MSQSSRRRAHSNHHAAYLGQPLYHLANSCFHRQSRQKPSKLPRIIRFTRPSSTQGPSLPPVPYTTSAMNHAIVGGPGCTAVTVGSASSSLFAHTLRIRTCRTCATHVPPIQLRLHVRIPQACLAQAVSKCNGLAATVRPTQQMTLPNCVRSCS